MKRVGHLFDVILQRENLRLAFFKACRGKRDRPEVSRFGRDLDRHLEEMAAQLSEGTFPVGRCSQFLIHDPKERIITAPCFAERVLHHAVMNVCEPILDRWLIPDSYACRSGKERAGEPEQQPGLPPCPSSAGTADVLPDGTDRCPALACARRMDKDDRSVLVTHAKAPGDHDGSRRRSRSIWCQS
jgi:hypothetical protein